MTDLKSQLRPYGRELLAAARRAGTPSPETRQRILEALRREAELAGDATTAHEPERLRGKARWVLLFALAAFFALGLYLASHLGAHR